MSERDRAAAYPDWIDRPRVNVTIVCGPLGNGARAWVDAHADGRDTIIDLNAIIAELAGVPAWEATRDWLMPALRERNARLQALSLAGATGHAYVIVQAPKDWQRKHWQRLLGGELVLLDPGHAAARAAAEAEGFDPAHVDRWYLDARGPVEQRPTASKRGYGPLHQALRGKQLTRQPFCEWCRDRGVRTPATEFDHIRPFTRPDGSTDWKAYNDPANRRSACAACHASFGAQRGRAEVTMPGLDGRPTDPAHPFARPAGPPLTILQRIEKYLQAHNCAQSRFGRLAAGDPRLIADLRRGRQPGKRLEQRLLAAIADPDFALRARARRA